MGMGSAWRPFGLYSVIHTQILPYDTKGYFGGSFTLKSAEQRNKDTMQMIP